MIQVLAVQTTGCGVPIVYLDALQAKIKDQGRVTELPLSYKGLGLACRALNHKSGGQLEGKMPQHPLTVATPSAR